MKLVEKGATAPMEANFEQLIATFKWSTAVDFDLAACYETKSGDRGLVYFGKKGSLSASPFMQLDEDAGVGDSGGDNEENLRIADLSTMKKVWLIGWDYSAVQKGEASRFADSDITLTVKDDKDTNHEVSFSCGEMGNVALMATIDNSGIAPKFINSSGAATLKGFPSDSKGFFEALDLENN